MTTDESPCLCGAISNTPGKPAAESVGGPAGKDVNNLSSPSPTPALVVDSAGDNPQGLQSGNPSCNRGGNALDNLGHCLADNYSSNRYGRFGTQKEHPQTVYAESAPPGNVSHTYRGCRYDSTQDILIAPDGSIRKLRPKSQAVFNILVNSTNQLVTHHRLFQSVWPGRCVTRDSLVQCILEIRRALRDKNRLTLQTISQRGYRLVADKEPGESARKTNSSSQNDHASRPDISGHATPVSLLPSQQRIVEIAGNLIERQQAGSPCHLLLLRGARGSGKSFLSRQLTNLAQTHGYHILEARCCELTRHIDYAPLTTWLRQIRQRRLCDPDRPDQQLLGHLLPELAPSHLASPADQGSMRHRHHLLHNAITYCLSSNQQPLLLILENLHRCDQHSRAVLAHLAGERPTQNILIVATTCETESVDSNTDMLAEVFQETGSITSLNTGTLNYADVQALAGVLCDTCLSANEVRQILEYTAGNLASCCLVLKHRLVPPLQNPRIPGKIIEHVRRQLHLLTERQLQLLYTIAARSDNSALCRLRGNTPLNSTELKNALETLRQRQLIEVQKGRYDDISIRIVSPMFKDVILANRMEPPRH